MSCINNVCILQLLAYRIGFAQITKAEVLRQFEEIKGQNGRVAAIVLKSVLILAPYCFLVGLACMQPDKYIRYVGSAWYQLVGGVYAVGSIADDGPVLEMGTGWHLKRTENRIGGVILRKQ